MLRAPIDNFRKLRSLGKFKDDDESVFWALRDINFDVQQGEVLGIIGHNGAGKSTLLKILSRITEPTSGEVRIKGRVAALLEVGTGFHQELSGRENIYMNGTILGMTRREIDRKLDEIVDFSGVEKYIDTPVKFYSSGMKVRLGFAVAAHLEPEILIIDEVLAVGDAEFQKKCLGKMESVAVNEGRTVLFVSHNMGAVQKLCNRGMVLEKGKVTFIGDITTSIAKYGSSFKEELKSQNIQYFKNLITVNNVSFSYEGKDISSGTIIYMGDRLNIILDFHLKSPISGLGIAIDVRNEYGELQCHLTNEDDGLYFEGIVPNSRLSIEVESDPIFFSPGQYTLNIWFGESHVTGLCRINNALVFWVEQSSKQKRTKPIPSQSKMFLPSTWRILKLDSI